MNVTFPDNANISIFVVPAGAEAPAIGAEDASPRLLFGPPAKPRPPSRRRDLIFVGTGALLSLAVLSVVRFQHTPAIDPAHAARLAGRVDYEAPPNPTIIPRHIDATPQAVDPQETVRRLLAQRPTITPPPGATAPQPAAPSSPGLTAAGKPNAFGMTD